MYCYGISHSPSTTLPMFDLLICTVVIPDLEKTDEEQGVVLQVFL